VTVSTEQFAETIRDRAALPTQLPDAQATIGAASGVLAALADQVTAGAAQPLAEQLPEGFATPLLQGSTVSEGGTMEAFYASVAERTGIPRGDVPALVTAVLRTVVETADEAAVRGVRDQLTTELQILLQTDTGEGDTTFRAAAGPQDPDAPKIAGPESEI
jgi:uncharacterized protein (DUF2267 family)